MVTEEPSMDIIIHRIKDNEHDKCLDIARNLTEWFNEKGLTKMDNDLKLHDTYGAYQTTNSSET
jgi:hypothetical protein